MPNGWKAEADFPSAYPSNSITYYKTNSMWNNKIPIEAIVKTTKSYNMILLQEVFRSSGTPLYYRMVDTSTGLWESWNCDNR